MADAGNRPYVSWQQRTSARRHFCGVASETAYLHIRAPSWLARFHLESFCMIRVVLAQPRRFAPRGEGHRDRRTRAQEIRPAYVGHEIVHNRHVVEDLEGSAARCSSTNWTKNPMGLMTVFSAHGVAKRVEEAAAERPPVIDATCPLVAKVHNEGRRYARQDREPVLVGHAPVMQKSKALLAKCRRKCIWCRPSTTWM